MQVLGPAQQSFSNWSDQSLSVFKIFLCRLGVAMQAARNGTGEVQHLLSSTTFHPRLPGMTGNHFNSVCFLHL